MNDPSDRIRAIESSLRCFVLGLLGLVPLLGLPAACIAVCLRSAIRRDTGEQWNPARAYADWGCTSGGIGIAVTVALACLALAMAAFG